MWDTEKQKEFILTGNLWKAVFELSWPAVLAMLLLGANNVLDGIFVGQFVGETALAGVSIALPPVIVLVGLGVLVGTGAGTLLSISIGAEDIDVQKKLYGNVNSLTLLFSIVIMPVGLIFASQILFLMGGREDALILSRDYYQTLLWGTPVWIYSIAANNLIRSEGKMKTSALIMAIGLLVNAVSNYVLMVLLGWGIKGAALGTNIGMSVQTVIAFFYFAKKNPLSFRGIFSVRFDKAILTKILSMGLAGFIMQFMGTIQIILVLNVLNYYGNESDIAFYGVIGRLFSFIIQPLAGFMFALTPIIGMNFGAGKNERVIAGFKRFLCAAFVLIIPCWLLLLAFPEAAVSLMLKNPVLSSQNIFHFRLYMALLPVMPLVFLTLAFFPTINKGKISSILGIMQQVVLYVPVMFILPIFTGVAGVYYGTFLIEFVSAVPVFILIKREFRLLRTGVTKWEEK